MPLGSRRPGRDSFIEKIHAQVLPRFGFGREREAGVPQECVGDELRGLLSPFRIPLSPAGVMLERARHHHACHGCLVRCASVSATQSGE